MSAMADQLVLAGESGLGVAGDLLEQEAASRGDVVDLVDVGAELAATRGHLAPAATGPDPAAVVGAGDAGGADEEVLDRVGGGRLPGRHRGRADEHAVDRHRGLAVGHGHEPARYSTARSGVPMPPPTQTTRFSTLRSSAYVGVGARRGPPTSGSPRFTILDARRSPRVSTSLAIAITARICLTVPGLKTTCEMPASCRSSMIVTASSRSATPALITRPSKGAPDWRAFWSSRWPPTWSFHR